MIRRNVFVLFVVLAMVTVSTCGLVQDGPVRSSSETVELAGAESVVARISMGAGTLQVNGGAEALMDAVFTYNVEAWEPEVSYSVEGANGTLNVQQPARVDVDPDFADYRYEWELSFNNDVPIDMEVSLGAGESTLDLNALTLAGLDVDAGAGQMTIDLTGSYDRDVQVNVTGGVGSLTMLLPEDTGVQVNVSAGLGNLVASGFTRQDDTLVNDVFGTTPNTLFVDIQGGIGEINLQLGG